MKKETLIVVVAIGIMIGAAMAASELLGEDRRLPPRDYVPFILATIAVAIAMARDNSKEK